MKTTIVSLVSLFLLGTMTLVAQSKTEKFMVYGNCGMCEKRIETAANSVEGVTASDWNKKTKQMEVTFDQSKTDVHKVHMAIAKVGHDTDMHKAKDKDYNKLADCCKYDRAKAKKKPSGHEGHNHSH